MKSFVVYTAARIGLLLVAFALVWAVAQFFVDWSGPAILVTGLIAVFVSAVASLFLLRRLREEFALTVQRRAERMAAAVEQSRRGEDEEMPGDDRG